MPFTAEVYEWDELVTAVNNFTGIEQIDREYKGQDLWGDFLTDYYSVVNGTFSCVNFVEMYDLLQNSRKKDLNKEILLELVNIFIQVWGDKDYYVWFVW